MYRSLTFLCLVIALASTAGLIYAGYEIRRDIEGWKTRAQVSSEPNDMYFYMSNVKSGLEKHGMTEGYSVPFFATPDNDMGLIAHTVNQHVDQAKVLTTMDRSSPEYQTGLDNLRGSIRELDLHTYEFWGWHSGLQVWILCLVTWIGVLAFGFCWLEDI